MCPLRNCRDKVLKCEVGQMNLRDIIRITFSQTLAVAAVVCLAMGAFQPNATAQTVRGLDSPGTGEAPPSAGAPSSFIIEPDAQIKGDQIKQQTYRSQSVGKNQNWDLDIGRFQAPYNEDPAGLAEDIEDSDYSGMRLRLPFRGRTGQ